MRKLHPIDFDKVPADVRNYYDKGPSARRVLRARVRMLYLRCEPVGEEYAITHTYGIDYWRQDEWNEWRMHRTTNPDAVTRQEA